MATPEVTLSHVNAAGIGGDVLHLSPAEVAEAKASFGSWEAVARHYAVSYVLETPWSESDDDEPGKVPADDDTVSVRVHPGDGGDWELFSWRFGELRQRWWRIGRWNEEPVYGWGTRDEAWAWADRIQGQDHPGDRSVTVEPDSTDPGEHASEGFSLCDALGEPVTDDSTAD